MDIKEVVYSDLAAVAILHKKLFKDHYLGRFSIDIISKFYSNYIDNKELIFIAVYENGILAGFVLGGESQYINASNRTFMKSNVGAYIREILLNPILWPASIKKFLNLFTKEKTDPNSPNFRLLSIGVNSDYQGKGIAKLLLENFELKIPPGVSLYGLSVKKYNKRAIAFYLKSGFVEDKTENNSLYLKKKI